MQKENLYQAKSDVFHTKKDLEQSCLNDTINKIPWLQKFKLVEDVSQERPDFILEGNNEFIGIEHFHIDMLYIDKKKHTCLSRYTYTDLRELFKKYHVKALTSEFKLQDANDAKVKLEGIVNELVRCHDSFDYNYFMKEWDRIFENHYKKRFEYREGKHLGKLGFLIEIRRYFHSIYICKRGKTITKEISECLNKYGDGVDFFIIVIKGLFDDYTSVKFFDKNSPAKERYDNFELKKISKNIKLTLSN